MARNKNGLTGVPVRPRIFDGREVLNSFHSYNSFLSSPIFRECRWGGFSEHLKGLVGAPGAPSTGLRTVPRLHAAAKTGYNK